MPAPMMDDHGKRLELFKLAMDMADRVSARRGTANAFFLTLNTALAGFAGIVRSKAQDDPFVQAFRCVAG